MNYTESISAFLDLLESWKFGYTSVLYRYLASKKGEDKFLMYGLVGFTNEVFEDFQPVHVETKSCVAGQNIASFNESYYQNLIKSLSDKPHIFNVNGNLLKLPLRDGKNFSSFYDPRHYPNFNPRIRSPYVRISGDSDDRFALDDREIDFELRNLETPYEDMRDLLLSLSMPLELIYGRTPHIDYIAMLPVRHTDGLIEKRKRLKLTFEFPSKPDLSKFKVGVRTFQGNHGSRFRIEGTEFEIKKETSTYKVYLEKEIEECEVANVFPSYQGQNMGALIIVDPDVIVNDRPVVDSVYYEENFIDQYLLSKESDEFEFGVSTLLHYLKLSVQRYSGLKKLTDGPDLVAFSNSGHVYLVECTIGTPNHKGKLHKLYMRTKKLLAKYQKSGRRTDLIRPVLFTNLSRENTSEDLADLANYNISLVTRDEFEDLLHRVANPPSDQELFEAALNAVPTKDQKEQGTGQQQFSFVNGN